MSIDLDALERIAQAATPGPWLVGNSQMYGPSAITRDAEGLAQVQDSWVCDADAEHPNAEHIAAFNPNTALTLIARVRELEAIVNDGGNQAAKYWTRLTAAERALEAERANVKRAQAEAWEKGWETAIDQAPGDTWFDEWSYQNNPYDRIESEVSGV